MLNILRRVMSATLLLALTLSLAPAPATAQQEDDLRFLVTASWLAQLGSDPTIIVVDTRPAAAYAEGHIPGAVNLPIQSLAQPSSDEDQLGPWQARASALLGSVGISRDHEVVVYDDHANLFAARLRWVLKHLGHEQALVLDGGLSVWTALGQPIETEASTRPAASYFGSPDAERMVGWSYLLGRLGDPDLQLIDVRAGEPYSQGHIPTALNLDWNQNVEAQGPRTYRSLSELQALYDGLGLDRNREIVVYCTTGIQASNTLLALEMLGYPRLRLYSGSWSEWSTRDELPKAAGPEPGAPPR